MTILRDLFAAALAVRVSDAKRFGFELGATIPLAGSERTMVALDLRFTARLGPLPQE